jgi:hypothetical protein
MRLTLISLGLLAVLAAPARVSAQRPDQPQQPPVNEPEKVKEPKPAPQTTPPPPPVPPAQIAPAPAGDSLAAAARKAREAKSAQAQSKPAQVFDNDNIPTQGGVSAIGPASDASVASGDGTTTADTSASSGAAAAPSATPGPNDEKAWRETFAKLRHKLDQDQDALNIMQRELGVLDVQYYNDPNKALQQNLTRSDINEKTAKIDAAKAKVAADNQAISDMEDQLRRAGGDIGWSR